MRKIINGEPKNAVKSSCKNLNAKIANVSKFLLERSPSHQWRID